MITNFLKIAIRSLFKYKSSTFINIAGLAVGLAATILILMWIQQELSYDKFYTDSELLYRVEQDQNYGDGDPYHVTVTPVPAGPVWKSDIAEITDFTRYSVLPKLLFEKGDLRMFENGVGAIDSSFFRMFDFKFIYGEPATALKEPHSIVISEDLAEKYFGYESPIGRQITIEKQTVFTVSGVLEDLPDNTTFNFNALVPYEYLYETGQASDNSWQTNSVQTFVKLIQSADIDDVGEKITNIILEHNPNTTSKFEVNLVQRIRLHGYFGYASPVGPIIYIYIFGAISLFVLLIACINFINLSTARSANRAKEIGIKKVSGGLKRSIKTQFLIESILQVFIALLFALILVGLLIGVFNTVSGKSFEVSDLFKIQYIIGYILLAVFTGILAGLYPAFYLASFKPIEVLKGGTASGFGSGRLRKILVIIQFVLSIFLTTCGLVIYKQVSYMRDIDVGYNKENTLRIPMRENVQANYQVLKAELEKHPLIEDVSGTMFRPHYMGSTSSSSYWEGKDPEQRVLICYNAVDYDYFNTMEINLKYGRVFSEGYAGDISVDTVGNFIINEELAKLMGMENPVGERFSFIGVSGTIVGVMNNFYFKPASEVIEPMAFICTPAEYLNNIVIKLSIGNRAEALEAIEEIWTKVIPDYPFDYRFIANDVETLYRSETRMGDLFKYFTILALLLASMGLYGLSSYIAEQKNREIGIRKVMGASVGSVVGKLTGEFLVLVGIALVIGLPLAWLYINNWLQDFPYRINIGPAEFLLVALISLSVAAIAVSFQSYKAGRTNPVDTLRME